MAAVSVASIWMIRRSPGPAVGRGAANGCSVPGAWCGVPGAVPCEEPVRTLGFGEAGFERGQRGDDDVADDLQAAGADGVEVVLGRVPRRVFEIDDVHRRDAGSQEGKMVVFNSRRLGDE